MKQTKKKMPLSVYVVNKYMGTYIPPPPIVALYDIYLYILRTRIC